MKKLVIAVSIVMFAFSANSVSAGCVGAIVNGRCTGTEIDNVDGSGDSNTQRYEGSTGAKYQYDLQDPRDRINYNHDLDAQRRDQKNADPRQKIDRSVGQYGGGFDN